MSRAQGPQSEWRLPWSFNLLVILFTVVVVYPLVLVSAPVVALAVLWSKWRLRRAIRCAALAPCVIVQLGDPKWEQALRTAWLPKHASATVLLPGPDTQDVDYLALPWRVYRWWGPDFKTVRPPVALVVGPFGQVERVEFRRALNEAASGDDAALQRQWALLETRLQEVRAQLQSGAS